MSIVVLGTYVKGEVPFDLVYSFLDNGGTAIDVTGASVKAVVTNPDFEKIEVTGSVSDASAGEVSVPWSTTMTDTVGSWRMTVWADLDGGQTLASAVLLYNVAPETAPTF